MCRSCLRGSQHSSLSCSVLESIKCSRDRPPSGGIGIGGLPSMGKLQGRSSGKRLQRACSQERDGPMALDPLSAQIPLHEELKKVSAAALIGLINVSIGCHGTKLATDESRLT